MGDKQQPAARTRSAQLWEEEAEREIHSGMAGPAGSTSPVINAGAASAAGAIGSGSGDSLGLLAARRAFHGGPPREAVGAGAPGRRSGGAVGVDLASGSQDMYRPAEPTAIPTTERFPDSPAG